MLSFCLILGVGNGLLGQSTLNLYIHRLCFVAPLLLIGTYACTQHSMLIHCTIVPKDRVSVVCLVTLSTSLCCLLELIIFPVEYDWD